MSDKANLRMLFVNDALTATLSMPAGQAIAKKPVTSLQNAKKSQVLRTTTKTNVVINGEWSGFKQVNCFALDSHNLSPVATWRIEGFDNAAQAGSKIYDSGVVRAIPAKKLIEIVLGIDSIVPTVFDEWIAAFSVHWLEKLKTIRSFRITINDPNNPAAYLEFGRLYAGRSLEAIVNFNRDSDLQWIDESEQIITDGSTNWTEHGAVYRKMTFQLHSINAFERPHWFDAIRKVGIRSDIFVSMFPEQGGQLERDYTMPAKLATTHGFKRHTQNIYQTEFELVEV